MASTHPAGLRILTVALLLVMFFVAAVSADDAYELALNEDFNHGVKCMTVGTSFNCEIVPMASTTSTTTAEPERPAGWPADWPVIPKPYDYFCAGRNDELVSSS